MAKDQIIGGRSATNQDWIGILNDGKRVWQLQSAFSDRSSALKAIAKAGIILPDAKAQTDFLERVRSVDDFRKVNMLEKIGWNGGVYVMPDGTIISPVENEQFEIPWDLPRRPLSTKGKGVHWRQQVVKPLRENPMALFAIAAGFVGPLLRFLPNPVTPAFEFVGPRGIGKTTVQRLAMSVIGSPSTVDGYWTPLERVGSEPDQVAAEHSDSMLVLDRADQSYVGLSARQRKDVYRGVAFDLAAGGRGHHMCIVSSSNVPLASWLGDEELAAAEARRLLVIPLEGRPSGMFDKVPSGVAPSQFADQLIEAANANHGRAFRSFIQRLVDEHAAAPEKLHKKVDDRLRTFRDRAGIDLGNGEEIRRADAFGVVYAAAALAREYGALPSRGAFTLGCYGNAVLETFSAHIAALPRTEPFEERLIALAKDPRTADIRQGVTGLADATQAKSAPFVLNRRAGIDELMVRRISDAFSDWEGLKGSTEARAFRLKERGHATVKRTIEGDIERVYVFRLPSGWDKGPSMFEGQ